MTIKGGFLANRCGYPNQNIGIVCTSIICLMLCGTCSLIANSARNITSMDEIESNMGNIIYIICNIAWSLFGIWFMYSSCKKCNGLIGFSILISMNCVMQSLMVSIFGINIIY